MKIYKLILILIFLHLFFKASSQNTISPYSNRIIDYSDRTSITPNLDLQYKVLQQLQRQHDGVMSCQQAHSYITQNGTSLGAIYPRESSWLTMVNGYKVLVKGAIVIFAIADIKNDYGQINTFVFCNIPKVNWKYFTDYDLDPSWGTKFHKYIINHTCNCY